MRRAAKKDLTHDQRVNEMLRVGLNWIDLHDAPGRLDGIAQNPHSLKAKFVELKNTKKEKLTDDEIKFMNKHPGQCAIITCLDDVLKLRNDLI